MIFRYFDQITTLTYFNLNLRSYGQLFVLVFFSLSNPDKNLNMDHIMKTHFFYEMNYDLKGHGRSHNDFFKNIVVRKVILH